MLGGEDAVTFGGCMLTRSMDGTVKIWMRENARKKPKYLLDRVLLIQENAVMALALSVWPQWFIAVPLMGWRISGSVTRRVGSHTVLLRVGLDDLELTLGDAKA